MLASNVVRNFDFFVPIYVLSMLEIKLDGLDITLLWSSGFL